ncbi:uncharacterized protein LOC121777885 [Salvia splendens]|nr:uncharacterized protein LOC121777885 [Salvia splendens]
MGSRHLRCFFWLSLVTCHVYSVFISAGNSIPKGVSVVDGGGTIISAGERFELGFFSPNGSRFRYVGVWHYGISVQPVVWVANRDKPLSGNDSVLAMGDDGNLQIKSGDGEIFWSTSVSSSSPNSTVVLLDTGNLAIFPSPNSKRMLWQSFHTPTDTYLPDMEVHMDAAGAELKIFRSWKSAIDPSPGNYTLGLDPRGSPQIVIWEGENRRWRSGHWNGISFIGVTDVRTIYLSGFRLTNQGNGKLFFTYTPSDSSFVKFQIDWEGVERQETWSNGEWRVVQAHPVDDCDRYNRCGPFGVCDRTDRMRCRCMEGFVIDDGEQWCKRRARLQCGVVEGVGNDGFGEVEGVKLPDFVDYVGLESAKECQRRCLHNCSCIGYAFVSGINCMIWTGDLVDVERFVEGGNTLFVRLAASELGETKRAYRAIIITAAVVGSFLLFIAGWLFMQRRRKRGVVSETNEVPKVGPSRECSIDYSGPSDLGVEGQQGNGTELALYSFNSLVAATDNFSDDNKLGQGGFGHVYKGILPDGQEIAVKRLSRKSGQGLQEFKNEVMLIAKLQHRNLVRLLGCCIQGEENILLYEYMPNKSLDSYLFDPDKKPQLDWSKRFSIITGIARGLLYLHRDSRLRIIHRDLKVSNILLDEEMNPKISDFGMARIFGGNQNEANTNIVVGTYGYMAPEYAMEGLFSLKSDVYSFGVLLLEIITGQRNASFRSTDFSNMVAFAWDLWDKGRAIELLDSSIRESSLQEQVLRCIHVGMLCVQDVAANRPNMPAVLLMLEGENVALPLPRQPTFTSMRHNLDEDMWNVNQDAASSNNVTITAILGRITNTRNAPTLSKMRNAAERPYHLRRFLITFTLLPLLTASTDLITPTNPLTQNHTLVSAAQQFELGFFPGALNTWYVGIWYKNIPERVVVWVANRDSPLTNSSGVLKISPDGTGLILSDHSGIPVWSANHTGITGTTTTTTIAVLLDNGNFVVHAADDEDPESYLWQSFDHPTDTLLPGMKLGWDSKTGLNRYITSWKSADDPSTGDFSFKLDISGYPEIHLTNRGKMYYRSGPWNGLRFSGVPEMRPSSPLLSFLFVRNREEVSYSFTQLNESMHSRLLVKHSGFLQRFIWIPSSGIWNLFWYAPKDQCDDYRECGVYGICDANASPVCKCMKAFRPKNPQAWNLRDGSDGCVRETELECDSDGFLAMSGVKLPESGGAFVDAGMGLDQCREMCQRNCSCRGYSSSNISDGSGCVIWAGDLYDMRQYAAAEGGGQDFYYRVPAAELVAPAASAAGDDSNKTRQTIMITGIVVGSAALLVGFTIFLVWKKRKPEAVNILEPRGSRERSQDYLTNSPTIPSKRDQSGEAAVDELELPLFDITTLVVATNKFCDENKLGQGGFGIVYKGVLAEGQEIAVKRLSKTSVQGVEEFKNEVKLIARLQHRNLVRLLGCCVEMEEKMLVYEYLENKSLDSILFKKNRSSMLDWQTRFMIICGIARGLLYLHQDSRFRIIHRDLKASNILLDKGMDPKISDFGMARIFGGDQTEANTKRVVGTYGYMSPEYAMDGLFSIKSDVFSFGVLVLEIVSGTKNRGFYQTNNQLNLLAYAWKLYREGRALEVVDAAAGEEYVVGEAMRCIQVGLLCVQEHAEDRPNMSNVVLMLSSDFVSMQQPKHPGYCLGRRPNETDSSSPRNDDESCTINQVTVTMLDGR